MWAKCTDTCFVSSGCLIRYTTGDNLEHIMYGPRHGWTSFGFGPSVLWWGLCTSTFCPGVNSGIGGNLELLAFCLLVRSDKFLRTNSNAICKFSLVEWTDFFRGGGSANVGNTRDYINRWSCLSPKHQEGRRFMHRRAKRRIVSELYER